MAATSTFTNPSIMTKGYNTTNGSKTDLIKSKIKQL
jgi:hypothetical protein